MGRWRPPSPKSSPYITPGGYRSLEAELEDLWKRRTEVTRALSAAAAEGDRSENAEYIYRKKELRGIDARLKYLQQRMPRLKVVNRVGDTGRIYFGAWVSIEDESGEEHTYRIVGADEIDSGKYYISVDSPMGKSLLGKAINDEVTVSTAAEKKRLIITAIHYESPDK
ncbi:MAG TPA: transcription elongation factor GreB [Gammaproteobacteria bacterium]|nr:transcription elongation factor GreB [Gammaproteobacteria bacterium]